MPLLIFSWNYSYFFFSFFLDKILYLLLKGGGDVQSSSIYFIFVVGLAFSMSYLKQSAIFQVILDDNISYGIKNKLDIVCVCGARKVRINFFFTFATVQVFELQLHVGAGLVVCVGT